MMIGDRGGGSVLSCVNFRSDLLGHGKRLIPIDKRACFAGSIHHHPKAAAPTSMCKQGCVLPFALAHKVEADWATGSKMSISSLVHQEDLPASTALLSATCVESAAASKRG